MQSIKDEVIEQFKGITKFRILNVKNFVDDFGFNPNEGVGFVQLVENIFDLYGDPKVYKSYYLDGEWEEYNVNSDYFILINKAKETVYIFSLYDSEGKSWCRFNDNFYTALGDDAIVFINLKTGEAYYELF